MADALDGLDDAVAALSPRSLAAVRERSGAALAGTLKALGLDWRFSDVGRPNLLYMLASVDGSSVQQGKTLLNINLDAEPSLPSCSPASPSSSPLPVPTAQLELVEKESVQSSIPLSRLISCEAAQSDLHTLQLVHLADGKPRKRQRQPQATCEVLSLIFPSLEDAQDVCTILKACIHCAQSPSPSPSPLLAKTIHGQLCLHQGWVEKKSSSSSSYARRYLRLFPNRLLLYRSVTAAYPVNVLPLTVDELDSHAVVRAKGGKMIEVDLRAMWGVDGRECLLWRVQLLEDQQRWINAIATEQGASFRTPIGAILTATLRAALRAGSSAAGEESDAHSRRGSTSGSSACPPPLHPPAQHSSHRASPRSSRPSSFSFGSNPLPCLHQPGQAPPLSSLLSSPRSFLHYLLHLSSLPLLFPSFLPCASSFLRLTPQAFLKKRGKLMVTIDCALSSYHSLVSSVTRVWSESRLVMVDEMEQSGSSQVGFSFPGFDAQVFDVGRLSVIACHQLLSASAHELRFTGQDYQSAIESSSPAKELMQSSPDVASLFECGRMEEARQLSCQAQRLLLHHCALAVHIKSRTTNSARHTLKTNELIPWSSVQHTVASAAKNQAFLDSFVSTAYIANPSPHTLQLLLAHAAAEPAVSASTTFSSAPASPQGSPGSGSPLSSMPSSPINGGKRILKELWHARRGSDLSGFGLSKPPVSPVHPAQGRRNEQAKEGKGHSASPASSPSHSPPSHSRRPSIQSVHSLSSALNRALPEEIRQVRPLVNPLHLLVLLRCLLGARMQALQPVEAACGEWIKKRREERGQQAAPAAHAAEPGGGGGGHTERMDGVLALLKHAEEEKLRLLSCLCVLPPSDELERHREMQEREDRDMIARNALIKRRIMEDTARHGDKMRHDQVLSQHAQDDQQQQEQPMSCEAEGVPPHADVHPCASMVRLKLNALLSDLSAEEQNSRAASIEQSELELLQSFLKLSHERQSAAAPAPAPAAAASSRDAGPMHAFSPAGSVVRSRLQPWEQVRRK